jgi:hypothetical protein
MLLQNIYIHVCTSCAYVYRYVYDRLQVMFRDVNPGMFVFVCINCAHSLLGRAVASDAPSY